MVGSGYAPEIQAGLNKVVFKHAGEPLPESFEIYPSFVAHGYIALLLAGFIILHVLAALYHHFVRKDGLLRRKGVGRRGVDPWVGRGRFPPIVRNTLAGASWISFVGAAGC